MHCPIMEIGYIKQSPIALIILQQFKAIALDTRLL